MWETKSGKFTTSKNVNIDFCLPEFSATNIIRGNSTWMNPLKLDMI